MSHFSVAVITEDWVKEADLEEILLPYSENLEVKPYVSKTVEEQIKEFENFKKKIESKESKWYEEVQQKDNILAMKPKEFAKWYHGKDSEFDLEDNLLSTYNPNSKWDWFEIGGRWSELLVVKKEKGGIKLDYAQIKDIDWKRMNKFTAKDKNYWSRFWDIVVDDSPQTKLELKKHKYFILYKKEYYLEQYRDKEMFLRRKAEFSTHALVTPDGKWYEQGKMGWFGFSDTKPKEGEEWDLGFYEKFIEPFLNTNYIITIVDCHI